MERWLEYRMELVFRDLRYTSYEFSDILGVPFALIQGSLKDYMNMSSIVVKSVPHCDNESARCALYVHEFLTNNR
jgi:hypothetical protein